MIRLQNQFEVLVNERLVEPNVIVSIIDETDIADEFWRYQNFNKHGYDECSVKQILNLKKRFDNWTSERAAITKLTLHVIFTVHDRVTGLCAPGGARILQPLIEGPSDAQAKIFRSALEDFIISVLNSDNVEHMVIVLNLQDMYPRPKLSFHSCSKVFTFYFQNTIKNLSTYWMVF